MSFNFFWKFKKNYYYKIQKMSLTKPSKMEKENYTNTTDVLNQLVGQYSSDSDDEKVGEKRTGIIS